MPASLFLRAGAGLHAGATRWFFERYSKQLFKLLLMPFDINCGDSVG